MKRKKILVAVLFAVITVISSCKSSSETTEKPEQKRGGKRMSIDALFTQMDSNKDGKLSKSEVKGPLAKEFSKIDANNDGFISKEELKNAPKPERKQRPRN